MSHKEAFIEFTPAMKDYTILAPDMLSIHFDLMAHIFHQYGYRLEILKNNHPTLLQEGLKYVHNDTCYPALCVIGQMIDALQSGNYDLDQTALLITQTGGGCRASNYIHLLRKALKKANLGHIPVISLNFAQTEQHSGFKMPFSMLRKLFAVIAYGDLLMLLRNQIRPYEAIEGSTQAKVEWWEQEIAAMLGRNEGMSLLALKRHAKRITQDFAQLETVERTKKKVGIVGEIYVKYAALGNNHLEEFLHEQDCEVNVPGLMGFIMFNIDARLIESKLYGGYGMKHFLFHQAKKYFEKFERALIDAVKEHERFTPPAAYATLKEYADGFIGHGNLMGEGWLLSAEMLELAHAGYENIICTQPFGCLPNHIVGKGMAHKLKRKFPDVNVVAIDYDPGATKVNQENRIKLMLSMAKTK